ncbi:hypothetical protein Bca52824_050338, partial [Brassica carinata]
FSSSIMVTSERLANVEPWLHRQGFNVDSWLLHDAFSHDSDLLAKSSPCTPSQYLHHLIILSLPLSSTLPQLTPFPVDLIKKSSAGGGAKRKRNCILIGSQGKATKRRSRASKKPQTTFIMNYLGSYVSSTVIDSTLKLF